MRRQGNLIGAIATPDNLRLAFYKASRGKRARPEVLRYRGELDQELAALEDELSSGQVAWGEYRSFQVQDPKPRMIHAAPFRSRVAQHGIMNICEPAFEAYCIHDTYACRLGKGLDRALERALLFSAKGDWYLQLDVRKYFNSIDHGILNQLLERRFKDRVVLGLFAGLVDTFHLTPGKGIPIGNLISQHLANLYLGKLDHFIKERLRVNRYLRYMDDFVLWAGTREELREVHRQLLEFLQAELELKVKPPILNSCERGMTFLGYRVFPDSLGLARRTRTRFRRKGRAYVQRYQRGEWDQTELARHMLPMLAFVRRGASRGFRQRVLKEWTPIEHGHFPEARNG